MSELTKENQQVMSANALDIPAWSKADFENFIPHKWLVEQWRIGGSVVEADLLVKLATIAKGYGITTFRAAYRGAKKDAEAAQKQQGKAGHTKVVSIGSRTHFTGQPIPDGLFCGQYIADDDGIRVAYDDGNEEIVCHHPIMPVCKIQNIESGNEKTMLWYRASDGSERYLLVDSADLGRQAGIIGLRQKGIDVDFTTAAAFARYMRTVCMSPANYSALQVKQGVSRCGYIGDNYATFVPFADDYEYDGDSEQQSLYASLQHPGGSREKQFALFDWVRRELTPIARIAIAASLGSVLLYPLGPNPFFLHIWADKGAGKTLLLMLAASVWADPSDKSKYIKSLNATVAGCEAMASFLNALPFFLDESMTVADAAKIEDMIYRLCQGGDKLRATKTCSTREARSWRCIFLTSGERPLTNDSSNGGAVVRVVSINGTGQKFFGAAEQAAAVAEKIKTHYGWIGRSFIDALLRPDHLTEAKDLYIAYLQEFTHLGYDDKQSCAASVCMTADTLASKYVFADRDDSLRLTVDDFRGYLQTPLSSDAGYRTAQWLQELVLSNYPHFQSEGFKVSDFTEFWGRIDDDGYTLILRSILRREMHKANMTLGVDAFAAWARQHGIIETSKRDNSPFPQASINGHKVRVLKIRLYDLDSLSPAPVEDVCPPEAAPSDDDDSAEEILPF